METKKFDFHLVDHVQVYPTIGIARVGNSNSFFVGPEVPGHPAVPKVYTSLDVDVSESKEQVFKDHEGKIKRQVRVDLCHGVMDDQAARFRVYAFAKDGKVLGEITQDQGQVEWTVHLVNKKPAWYCFQGLSDSLRRIFVTIYIERAGKGQPFMGLRNPLVQSDVDPDLRTDLIIDGGVQT
jgi:hypothetical protein